MTDAATRPSAFPWPPLIYVAAIAASIVLWQFVPLPWFGSPMSDLLFAVGWLVLAWTVVIGLVLQRLYARRAATRVTLPLGG